MEANREDMLALQAAALCAQSSCAVLERLRPWNLLGAIGFQAKQGFHIS